MTLWIDSTIAPVLWLLLKATSLLGLSALVAVVMPRRTSAAARHGLWMCALVSLLLLPVVSRSIPEWPLTVRVLPATPPRASAISAFESSGPQLVPAGSRGDAPSAGLT